MTKLSLRHRLVGTVLATALAVTTVGPVAAQRIPVGGEFVQPLADQVQYRRKRRGGGGEGVAAALLLGAAALGVAAIVATRNKRERNYYAEQPYPYYGGAPAYHRAQGYPYQQGYYGQQQGYRGQPQGYYGQPQGYRGQPQGYYGQPRGYYAQPAPRVVAPLPPQGPSPVILLHDPNGSPGRATWQSAPYPVR